MKTIKQIFCFILLLSLHTNILFGQTSEKIDIFIDCNCDHNYLRQELSYVNHVRDQALANVQLFIFDIRNGSGGRSYTLNFSGQKRYNGLDKELIFQTNPNMTKDEIRKGLLKKLELGLLNYLLESDQADQIEFSLSTENESEKEMSPNDPWRNWIFEVYGEGEFEKESRTTDIDLEFGFEGDRVTEDWRFRIDAELQYSENRFKEDEETTTSLRKRNYVRGSVVRSLSNHWSAGVFGEVTHSSYNNLQLSYKFQPAIEYNIFPYEEVLRREITFDYRIGYLFNDYIEQTIYGKNEEHLWNHSLNIKFEFRQPWGDISTNLSGSAYLHDFSKKRMRLRSNIAVRIFKGFAVRISSNLELIRDQINLPAGDTSLEDILLQQRQIATDFVVSTSLGLSYTFGSSFNNIINTRL